MTLPLHVLLLDDDQFAGRLSDTLDCPVTAVTPDTAGASLRGLADTHRIVGLNVWPWPSYQQLHQQLAQQADTYRGVASWYALPLLAEVLADAVRGAVTQQAHVLFTSPDPGEGAAAETLAYLPQVADQVTRLVDPVRRSIAWRGARRQPSSVQALDALVDAHDVTRIVECPVVPAVVADETLRMHAERRGVMFAACDQGVAVRVGLLQRVVETVCTTEW